MDETVKRYSTEISRNVYEYVPGSMENSGDVVIGVPQASRRILWREGRPEVYKVGSIVNFHGRHEQVAIDALVRFFARVGSSNIELV